MSSVRTFASPIIIVSETEPLSPAGAWNVLGDGDRMMTALHRPLNRYRRAWVSRGFTLTELMAVVVIIGILATLAVVGYRKYINSAHSAEAVQVVGAIRAAQESYRSETLSYLNVSTNLDSYYPALTPGAFKTQWGGTGHADAPRWRMLNVQTDGPVMFGFATIAGAPNAAIPTGNIHITPVPVFPAPVEPWYLVQAKGDVNGDKIYSHYFASSFSPDGVWSNEGE